jgi:uncharacterized NAD(P)/FAD-binding protein YdhS
VTARRVAIVGGGAAGVLQAANLVRHTGADVVLIERAADVGRGAAYSTRSPSHLLNVRAAGMSAFPEDPDHFVRWLEQRGGGRDDFAQRRVYALYLRDLLDEALASGRLRVVAGEAVDLAGAAPRLASGEIVAADATILAVGNLSPGTPAGLKPEGLADDVYVADPWRGDIAAGLGEEDAVLLVGTGLTAVDAALTLHDSGWRGRTLALSRRGLVPRPHGAPAPAPPPPAGLTPEALPLLAAVRADAALIGWRAAVDRLRPETQRLWAEADPRQRRLFLRHLRPWWDVHRHRIAPSIAGRIEGMEAEGRLEFGGGRILSLTPEGDGARIAWRPRGGGAAREARVRRIVNCTGPSGDVREADEPLLQALLASGRIRPDAMRIGIDVDGDCRALGADGRGSDTLRAVGPLTKSAFWEIVAVPDIRRQVQAVALGFA